VTSMAATFAMSLILVEDLFSFFFILAEKDPLTTLFIVILLTRMVIVV
jgi:hypothetical protein